MKILLLGSNGQIGWELRRSLQCLGDLTVDRAVYTPDDRFDFTRPDQLAEFIRYLQPGVIVNAAAYTNVDRAEKDIDLARQINALTVGVIARTASKIGALLIHYSTDYVFSGAGNEPYDETSPVAPLSVYGQTKLEGEELIRDSKCRHLIFRTSWVYSSRRSNFARTMLRLATERSSLAVVSDQVGAPTGADQVADVTAHVLAKIRGGVSSSQRAEFSSLLGTYHCAAAGETSWYEYAKFVVGWANEHSRSLQLTSGEIKPISTLEFKADALRPLNSRLACGKLKENFSLELPDWKVGVGRMLHEYFGQ